jgi:tetratricopeptide (TPR) repeat protein
VTIWKAFAITLAFVCASAGPGLCLPKAWSVDDSRPALVNALLLRGAQYYRARQFNAAIADFDDVIRLSPDTAEAYLDRGVVYFALARYDLAVSDFNNAVSHDPASVDALLYRARAYMRLKQFRLAAADYDVALAANPRDQVARAGRCEARTESGFDPGAAMLDCSAALRFAPFDAALLRSRGILELRFAQLPSAIADFNASIARKPVVAATYFCRGVARTRMGDSAGGARDIALAEGIDPNIAGRYFGIGIAPPSQPLPAKRRTRRGVLANLTPVATVRYPAP